MKMGLMGCVLKSGDLFIMCRMRFGHPSICGGSWVVTSYSAVFFSLYIFMYVCNSCKQIIHQAR